jgi:hypothetical protein
MVKQHKPGDKQARRSKRKRDNHIQINTRKAGEEGIYIKCWSEGLRGRDCLEDLDVNGSYYQMNIKKLCCVDLCGSERF